MNVQIRKGKKEDMKQVLCFIKELADYEKAPDEVRISIKDLEGEGTGKSPLFQLIVAEDNNVLIGIALYYFGYSTWKGKMLYLDDLIVAKPFRRKGIGQALFESLIKEAKANKVMQMRWHVLDWNDPAIEFYKKYNASLDAEWITCKLTEEQIINFDSGDKI